MKVRIKNVQSIKSIDFEIKGFTCIVGKSNIGKSSILRAIRSLFKNKSGIVRKGSDYAEVDLEDLDLNIHWERGKNKNHYKINGKEFNKMNREIPPPILEAGIKEIKVGNSKIDLQTNNQFYPLFLVDKNGREAAEVISMVSRLDVISKASRLCAKDLKTDKGKLKYKRDEYVEIEEHLEKFFQLDDVLITLDQSTKDYEKLENKQRIIIFLNEKQKQLKTINNKIIRLKFLQSLNLEEFTLDQKIQKLLYLRRKRKQIEDLNQQIKLLNQIKLFTISEVTDKKILRFRKLKQVLSKLKLLDSKVNLLKNIQKEKLPKIRLDQKLEEITKLKEINTRLGSTNLEIKDLQKNIQKIAAKMEEITSKIRLAEKKLGICPVCNKEFDNA